MIGARERKRIMQQYANEPISATAVLLKCAVCLLIIAAIAALGTSLPEQETMVARTQDARP
jgi:hypothetical protein